MVAASTRLSTGTTSAAWAYSVAAAAAAANVGATRDNQSHDSENANTGSSRSISTTTRSPLTSTAKCAQNSNLCWNSLEPMPQRRHHSANTAGTPSKGSSQSVRREPGSSSTPYSLRTSAQSASAQAAVTQGLAPLPARPKGFSA